MKAILLGLALFAVAVVSPAAAPFSGRWDLTVTPQTGNPYPGWMEYTERDGAPVVRVQPRAGSVFTAPEAKLEGSRLLVTVSRATANRPETVYEITAGAAGLEGVVKRGGADVARIAGVRAPELKRAAPKAWTKPEPLFNGKDLSGWEPMTPAASHWVVRDGVLVNETKGSNLRSTRKFDDFKLHIELNCPEKGNSGVYLRGRYEMQVEYEPAGVEDTFHRMGAIYGMVPVSREMPRKAGEWESFDITLIGRNVTVVRDGVTLIDNQEIAGITGGALDSNEGEPGPFYIQGDHTGGILFRNITISVPKK